LQPSVAPVPVVQADWVVRPEQMPLAVVLTEQVPFQRQPSEGTALHDV
jgi:hypothetical protein